MFNTIPGNMYMQGDSATQNPIIYSSKGEGIDLPRNSAIMGDSIDWQTVPEI